MLRWILVAALVLVAGCAVHDRQQRASSAPSSPTRAEVVRAVDGDTLKVRIGERVTNVRLIGIDTPETHKPGVGVECGGREASANLARLAPEGSRVVLTPDPTQDSVDRYGRVLAYASVARRSLQLEQVYAGLAEVYVYGGKPFERVGSYRRAEGVARRAGRGVWGSCAGDFHSLQPGR